LEGGPLARARRPGGARARRAGARAARGPGGRARPDAAVGAGGRRAVGDAARAAPARSGRASRDGAPPGGRPRRLPRLASRAGAGGAPAVERPARPAGGGRRRERPAALDARAQPPGDGLGAGGAPLPARSHPPPAPQASARRPRPRDRCATTSLEPSGGEPPAVPAEGVLTAIVMPICEEPVERVFAGLGAIHRSVARAGALGRFHFFVLSDSADPSATVKEEEAWFDWCRAVGGFGRIFYRRRKVRLERKS